MVKLAKAGKTHGESKKMAPPPKEVEEDSEDEEMSEDEDDSSGEEEVVIPQKKPIASSCLFPFFSSFDELPNQLTSAFYLDLRGFFATSILTS